MTAIPTEITPASSDVRVPKMTRLSTSRPRSSVPIRWPVSGGLRRLTKSGLIGLYGAIQDAKTANTTMSMTTQSPTRARRLRANRLSR